MITPETILTLPKVANVQSVADGAVILLTDSGQLFTGNGTTDAILHHIDGRRTVTDLAAALQEEFDVSLDTAIADVIEITGMLVTEGVLRPLDQESAQDAGQTR